MTEIINEIDRVVLDSLETNIKAYGLCIPVKKGDQTHPVRVEDLKQVAIDDKWDAQYFHRLLADAVAEDEEFTFGSRMKRRHLHLVRTVVIVKRKLGFDWINCFVDSFPMTLDTVTNLPDYKFINVTMQGAINTNQDEIYYTEFAGAGTEQYEKHRIPYIIYAIEHNVDFIKCCVSADSEC